MRVFRAFTAKYFLLPLVLFVFNVLESRSCHYSDDDNEASRDSLLLTLDDSAKINNTRQTPNDHNVDISEEEIRLEYIKKQILQKLGMRHVPKVKRNSLDTSIYEPILEQLSAGHSQSSSPPVHEETDKLFVFPSKVGATHCIFNLTLSAKRSRYPIRSIRLFVKHRRSDEQSADMKLYSLSTSSASNRSAERLLAAVQPIEDTNEEVLNRENLLQTWFKWNEYNLTQILSKLVTPSDSNNQRILVDSEHLKIFSSFITIEYDYISTERVKRSIDCNPNGNSSSCCREPFYVNFTHIHWDDWILQPTGYYANYCKGKCDISHARYHHTTVVQKYQSIISLCCSPREMSPIPLIYIDENGYVLKKILMNMVVESCDCA